MNHSFKLIGAATSIGIVTAFAVTAPAFAWHPKGVITKYVQNQSTNEQMSDANTAATAVNAKPGDTLKYTIVIENKGTADSRGWNDMHFTKLTDTLPAGVELVSNPASRTITENIGVIKAGQKVTKEYTVKVTSTKNGDVVENKACFTGDSEVKDQPQKGCDVANAKVNVPVTPVPPVAPPVTPVQPKPEVKGESVEVPATLPVTGPANIIAAASTVTVLGYVGNLLRLKRRAQ